MYACIYIFLCDKPEPHIPNTFTAFSFSKWLLLWQQLLNSKFKEALSTNYRRRDATALCVKPQFESPTWLQSLVDPGHPGDLATCGLAPSVQCGGGNRFL